MHRQLVLRQPAGSRAYRAGFFQFTGCSRDLQQDFRKQSALKEKEFQKHLESMLQGKMNAHVQQLQEQLAAKALDLESLQKDASQVDWFGTVQTRRFDCCVTARGCLLPAFSCDLTHVVSSERTRGTSVDITCRAELAPNVLTRYPTTAKITTVADPRDTAAEGSGWHAVGGAKLATAKG